jgi:predicted nucleotidyltransferase
MKNYSLSKSEQEKITGILRGNGAVVGYLFGSYARGTAGPLSDIDIGVAFPKTIAIEIQEEKIESIRISLELMFGRDKADVANVPVLRNPLLRYAITLGEGEVLFADDVAFKDRLAALALREYEDTKSLRSIQYQALANLFA